MQRNSAEEEELERLTCGAEDEDEEDSADESEDEWLSVD